MRALDDRVNELHERSPNRLPWRLLSVVGVAALLWEGFVLTASQIWVAPDSAEYITLGIGIADSLDFSHEFFQYRTPGYPLLLAAIFAVFRSSSPIGILLVQHAMVVGCAILTTLTALTLSRSKGVGLVAGLLTVFGIHLTGYANAVLTEVPYAFAVTLCVCLLVHYHAYGRWKWLVLASIAAALAALIRPTGQMMPVICLGVALHRAWRRGRPVRGRPRSRRGATLVGPALLSTLPAAMLLFPVMAHNYRTFGHFRLTAFGGAVIYNRAAGVEGLNSARSPALTKLQRAFIKARRQNLIDPGIGFYDHPWGLWETAKAYRAIQGATYAETFAVMGAAGWDLMRENPWLIAKQTAPHIAGLVLKPDTAYLRQPGGETDPDRKAVAMYGRLVRDRVGGQTMGEYLPLWSHPRFSTPVWAGITTWYHRHVEARPPLMGVLGSPYEEYVILGVMGAGLALVRRNRATWLILLVTAGAQIAVSAFLMGPLPRYAVPLHPMIHVLEALAIVTLAVAAAAVPLGLILRLFGRRSGATVQQTIG